MLVIRPSGSAILDNISGGVVPGYAAGHHPWYHIHIHGTCSSTQVMRWFRADLVALSPRRASGGLPPSLPSGWMDVLCITDTRMRMDIDGDGDVAEDMRR